MTGIEAPSADADTIRPDAKLLFVAGAGWTKKHDDGRKELEEALGDKVETSFLENVPEGAESEATFERLAREARRR